MGRIEFPKGLRLTTKGEIVDPRITKLTLKTREALATIIRESKYLWVASRSGNKPDSISNVVVGLMSMKGISFRVGAIERKFAIFITGSFEFFEGKGEKGWPPLPSTFLYSVKDNAIGELRTKLAKLLKKAPEDILDVALGKERTLPSEKFFIAIKV